MKPKEVVFFFFMRRTPDSISKMKQAASRQIKAWEEEILHIQGKIAYTKNLSLHDPELGKSLRYAHEQIRQLYGKMRELEKQSKRRFF